MRLPIRLATATMVGGLLLLSGCSDTAVASESVEQEISSELATETGVTPESVECPDDLPADLDASMRCTLTAPDGSTIGVTVTVTGVDGTDVAFRIEVDDTPES